MLRIGRPLLRSTPFRRKLTLQGRQQRSSQTATATAPAPAPAPSSLLRPRRRFFRLSYLWYALVLAAGSTIGSTIRDFAAPLPLPLPGTHEDELALQALTSDIEALDVVKSMRKQTYHLHADTPLTTGSKGVHKGWIELDIKRNITESKEDWGAVSRTATVESMAGSRGLGVQRAFWNGETGELVAVVWIGKALGGWPGLAHGGAVATILQDCMARMVAGPEKAIDSSPPPTSLSVTYVKPTRNENFYIVRASFAKPAMPQIAPRPEPEPVSAKPRLPSRKDMTKKAPPPTANGTVEITGTLEDLKGKLCVRAKGMFPVEG